MRKCTAGPWTIWQAIDNTSRYPDVMSVLPRSSRLAKLVLDDADAALLLQALQGESAASDEEEGVVLDLSSQPALRWPEGESSRLQPVPLVRSASSGPATVVRLNPRFLARALDLVFREVRLGGSTCAVLRRAALLPHRSLQPGLGSRSSFDESSGLDGFRAGPLTL
jgi:hypothetical protein